jgi:hypothetical protein
LLLAIVGMTLFVLQNQQPIALVVFNYKLPWSLPLGIWVLLFIFGGIITSFCWQIFPSRVVTKERVESPNTVEGFYFDRDRVVRDGNTNTSASVSAANAVDWEEENSDDWDIEKPPQQTTIPKRDLETPQGDREVFEREQSPQPKNSTYSYGYRDEKDRTSSKKERIYDVNYRVIRPPIKSDREPPQDSNNDDEDWV